MRYAVAVERPSGTGRVLADVFIRRGLAADAALCVLAAALVALAAQVRIPLGFTPVPITGQTFAVLLAGAALGPARGVAAMLLYVAIGVLGAPVYTNGGHGIGHLLGATGGYLVGFVAAAGLLGRLAQRRADRHVVSAFAGMVAGSLVIYGCGVIGLTLATGVSPARAVELGVLPFLVGDVLKVALAAALLPAAWKVTEWLRGSPR